MKEVKLSDTLWVTAQACVDLAKKADIQLSITDIYSVDTLKDLAVIAGMLKTIVEKKSNKEITVINK